MTQAAKHHDLGPRGFKLVRLASASSYDPVAGIEWRPPKESDELYEALKKAFPARKTHRERMCEALVQFLAEELDNRTGRTTSFVPMSGNFRDDVKSANQSYEESKRPLFRTHAPKNDHVASSSPLKRNIDAVDAIKPATNGMNDDATKKSKDWDDMTVVWKSNIGLTKGARPRRMMTDAERTDYRMRRVRGACVACKRKKRKCNHDPEPSPNSSSETISTSSNTATPDGSQTAPSPQLLPQQPKPSVRFVNQNIPGSSNRSKGSLERPEGVADPSRVDEMFSSTTTPPTTSANTVKNDPSLYQPFNHDDFASAMLSQNDTLLFQNTNTPGNEPQFNWDLSGNEWQMLDLNHTGNISLDNLPSNMPSDAMLGNDLPSYAWDSRTVSSFDWALPSVPTDEKALPNPLHPIDMQPSPQFYDSLQYKDTNLGNTMIPLDCMALAQEHTQHATTPFETEHIPTLAELENHWALGQSQAHVEQWLKQKTIEEHITPLDPELSVPTEGPQEVETLVSESPRRRRVKFDFSSLIDGPPTLSPAAPAQPWQDECVAAVVKQEQVQVQPPPPRPTRSSSRHSTGSRMSFSDLVSLSSAMTSLSMKDAGSERNVDGDSDYDDEDEEDDIGVDENEKTDQNNEDLGSVSDDDESDDSNENNETENWTKWNRGENSAAHVSKDILVDKYIRINKPQKQS